MIPIAQLLVAPTVDQFRAQLVTLLLSLNVPADKWRKGGALSTMLTVIAMSLNTMAILVALAINGFFLPNATGQYLVNLAFYLYGITVPQATQATGQFTFTNTGNGVYSGPSFAAGKVIVEDSITGVTYVTTQDLNLTAAGGAQPVQTVGIQATIFGSKGNANPGDISIIVTTMLGVTGSNAIAAVGLDTPSDPTIRSLCLASLAARSVRGPRGAYQFAIQTASNAITGLPVNINRWWISPNNSHGTVTIFLASPSGPADGNDVQGVANNIEAVARPGAVTVFTISASAIAYSPTLTLWASAPPGVSSGQLQAAAATAVANFLSTYSIGGATAGDDAHPLGFTGLLASAVYAAAAEGLATLGSTFYGASGGTDLAMILGQVATDSVTIAVRIVITSSP